MGVIVPYSVEEQALDIISSDNYYLKLFVNDYTPTAAMLVGNFTEASPGSSGYAHKPVISGEWTLEANSPRDIILSQKVFGFSGELSGNATIYGWYLIKQDLSVVKAAKRLDSSYQPASGGGELRFTPRIQAGNGTPV